MKTIAFLQSVGVVAYIAIFAVIVQSAEAIVGPMDPSPIVSMTLFLLAFVTSALICSTIVFGYPITLFLDGKRREALETVGWTMGWCIVLLAVATLGVVLLR